MDWQQAGSVKPTQGKVSVCREKLWLLPRTRNRWRKLCSQWTSTKRHDCSALSSGLQELSKWVIVFSLASMNRWAHNGYDWREHSWPWQTGQVPWAKLSEKALQAYSKLESLSLHLSLPTGTHFVSSPICTMWQAKITGVRNSSEIVYSIIGVTRTHKIRLYVNTSVTAVNVSLSDFHLRCSSRSKLFSWFDSVCLSATWRQTDSESSVSCHVMLCYVMFVTKHVLVM